ncbi:tRNA lysidine(34) synthetase TilS [Lactobacillus sp. DCY120]|uniref:tRNA(Ile)-lysidine synthase n=1 Tax=Bombilactobacillus apium TaxID=2675299 RepID=A0A850R644_9LACO|nr:tRNA lysidine(34) synthetase TilS [Bombilactobacillus apium]NVY96307.1 tRNA lysidine(34) synthetase TilS [Bombilactobacillus apium]
MAEEVGVIKFDFNSNFFSIMKDQTESKFQEVVRQNNYFQTRDRVLVAVSGGSDSLALLALLLSLPADLRPQLYVASVDFQLRAESSQEITLVRTFCEKYQVSFFTTQWEQAPTKGMENAARDFRYAFFQKVMAQEHLTKLVTAHQNDDQLETVLMKLLRSGSFWEMKGITDHRSLGKQSLVRPLLTFSKLELQDYLQRRQLEYAVDATNFTDITLRNRLRRQVTPLLKRESPQLEQHVTNFVQQNQLAQQLVEQYFMQLEEKALLPYAAGYLLEFQQVTSLTPAQQALWIQFIFHQRFHLELSGRQLKQIEKILRGGNGKLNFATNLILQKSYSQVYLGPAWSPVEDVSYRLQINQPLLANQAKKVTIKQSLPTAKEAFGVCRWPQKIELRHPRPQDRLILANGQQQKLTRRFISYQLPLWQRQSCWVLTFDDQIVWVEKIYRNQVQPKNYYFKVEIGE